MSYLIDYARITNAGKLTDRFLTVQVRQPSIEAKIDKGTIVCLVEITKPWFPNSQIGQKIINALIREYQRSNNTSDLVNFELALKKTNKTLAYITQNGETDWIGNLNAVLAIIHDNALHLAQVGKTEAYLFRDAKISHITQHTSQDLDPHPLKTFSDISSGSLRPHDKIIISSANLFDYFSLEKLRQIIGYNSPAKAAEQISKILTKEKEKNVNLVILEINTKEDLANRTLEETNQTIYLDQKNLGSLWKEFRGQIETLGPVLEDIKKSLANALEKTSYFMKKHLLPKTKTAWERTRELSRKGYHSLKSKTAPAFKKIATPLAEKIKTIPNRMPDIGANIDQKASYNVHHYYQPYSERILPYWQKIKKFMASLGKNLWQIYHWLFDRKNRSLIYILLVAALAVVLILSIGSLRNKQLSQQELDSLSQILTADQNKYNNDFKLAILYNDKAKAKTILNDIISSLVKVQTNQSLASQANELLAKSQAELDKLNNTTRFSKNQAAFSLANANKIILSADFVYAYTNGGNSILFNSLKDNQQKGQFSLPSTDTGTLMAATNLDNNTFLAYSSTKQIYQNSGQQSLNPIKPLSGDWEQGNDLATFTGNLYILDGQNGQIYKHTKTASGYDKAINFLNSSEINIKGAISMTIDGAIYVLDSGGKIVKLSKGQLQDFNLKEIPSPNDKITKPKKIYTTSEINSLYVLDDNRLLELDKTGKYIKQYVADGLNNISDFSIDNVNKKILFLDSGNVYEFSL